MKLIHCADIHLDSRMETHLTSEQASIRNTEIIRSFIRMTEYAEKNGVRAVIIAGDMFDGKRIRVRTVNEIVSAMRRTPDIDYLYLAGNHDEAAHAFSDMELPQNFKQFTKKWDTFLYEDVAVSGIEISSGNAVSLYRNVPHKDNYINVVALHGQIGTECGVDRVNLKLLKDRVDELIDLGLPRTWTVNACAMGHCLITLYKATDDKKYYDILMSKIAYISRDALRFADHVLQHTVSANNDFPEQAWCDTLFMAAFLLLRVGVMNKDEDMINDALNQYYWHIKYLQNPGSGFYYHGYDNIAGDHMSGIYWGRANAWAAFTMSQVGGILPECYLYPKYMDVAGSLNEQLAVLKTVQTENGLWRTVLDDPDSYEEISASAGIAAAMLTRGNPLHSRYINKSIRGLLDNVSEDGKVMNVSAGTAVMRDREGYRGISKDWIQGWGQGLALAFFSTLLISDTIEKDGAL